MISNTTLTTGAVSNATYFGYMIFSRLRTKVRLDEGRSFEQSVLPTSSLLWGEEQLLRPRSWVHTATNCIRPSLAQLDINFSSFCLSHSINPIHERKMTESDIWLACLQAHDETLSDECIREKTD